MQIEQIGDIPILWEEPREEQRNSKLVIWLPGFTETKEDTLEVLSQLASEGFTALSFDPVDHGERSHRADDEELIPESGRFRNPETGHIYRHFWSIEAETAEEIPMVIDWAIANLNVSKEVGVGGKSMGGDIAVAAAALDKRIEAVAACISTPDWLKPGSIYELSAPNPKVQDQYDRLNPLTNIDNYAHCPAITFQCGQADPIVPSDGAARFVQSLSTTYQKQPDRIEVVLHEGIEHELTDSMRQNTMNWFIRFLKSSGERIMAEPKTYDELKGPPMTNEDWIELARTTCDHAGVGYKTIEIVATWDQLYCANAVYRLDEKRYLKIFGPTAHRQFHVERSALRTLEGHSKIPAPRVIAEGEPSGSPPYLALTEVSGSTAEHVWDELSRSSQLAVAGELGTITAAIHRLPQDDLAAVERDVGGRSEHIKAKQARLSELVKATETLSAQNREDMLHFLQVDAQMHLEGRATFTHSELAHNHIYLRQDTEGMDRWEVTGFIDWADAMLGPREWDVTFLWFWTFSRDRDAMRECFQTLYADSQPPEQFAQRCLAAILHTHSGPALWAEFVEQVGGRSNPIVRELTEYLFPGDVFGLSD